MRFRPDTGSTDEIRSIPGKGGFDITDLAQDLNLDRPVAIEDYLPAEFALCDSEDMVRPVSDKTRRDEGEDHGARQCEGSAVLSQEILPWDGVCHLPAAIS
jgi:hypothetical protein